VVAITSPAGAVVATYAYDPYGAVTQVGGSDATLAERNPLRYCAYYHDAGTGHYYLPARYYDPDTMRFLSPDPAPPSAGEPLTLNRYAYCVGDPVNHSDSKNGLAVASWRPDPHSDRPIMDDRAGEPSGGLTRTLIDQPCHSPDLSAARGFRQGC
jgi:RHS repeat-associated protein